jgi:hypothetical protein
MRDRRDKEVEVVKREAGGKGLLVCLSTRRVDRLWTDGCVARLSEPLSVQLVATFDSRACPLGEWTDEWPTVDRRVCRTALRAVERAARGNV